MIIQKLTAKTLLMLGQKQGFSYEQKLLNITNNIVCMKGLKHDFFFFN